MRYLGQILLLLSMISCHSKTGFFIIKNKNHCQAFLSSYGARLVSLSVPDKNGIMTSVVLGFDSVEQYEKPAGAYYGATIGRYGNRIAKGKFELEGKSYQIPINDGFNTLHGGKSGFNSKEWSTSQPDEQTVVFSYISKDGEEGFPGNLEVTVTYSLTDSNALRIEYNATPDNTTVINLTNHAFFNLNGEGSGNILNQALQINADYYTAIDSGLIPTGKIEPVKATPLDFTSSKTIGKQINDTVQQLINAHGYDHNFVLNGKGMKLAAVAVGDQSGIKMEVWTEEPGLQFYSGNFGESKNKMRKGLDDFRSAFCLETQHFPDSPNEPSFPSTVWHAGEHYHSLSIYKFFH